MKNNANKPNRAADPRETRSGSRLPAFVLAVAALATAAAAVPAVSGADEARTVLTSIGTETPRYLRLVANQLNDDQETALVRAIQDELNAHGYGAGAPDGVIGPRTRQAISSYQRDAGLVVDSTPTKDLLDHLKFAEPEVIAGTALGAPAVERVKTKEDRDSLLLSKAELVTAVQRELALRGYYEGTIDGVSGPMTRRAVRAFQRDAGFTVNGVLDQSLLDELRTVETAVRSVH